MSTKTICDVYLKLSVNTIVLQSVFCINYYKISDNPNSSKLDRGKRTIWTIELLKVTEMLQSKNHPVLKISFFVPDVKMFQKCQAIIQ